MAFFNNLKSSLKQKWLQYFQVNRYWIMLHMEVESVYTPDGGRRPPSSLILGVVNALEPQLAELMVAFCELNPVPDALIDVLELNFDPDLLLGNRFNAQAMPEELSEGIVIQTLTELESDLSDVSFTEAEEVVLVETDDGSLIAMSEEDAAALVSEMTDESVLMPTDESVVMHPDEAAALVEAMVLNEIVQDVFEESSEAQSLETPSAPQQQAESPETPNTFSKEQTESGEVMSDVWVEDASSPEAEIQPQASDIAASSKERQVEDDEISRLFPNL